MALQRILSQSLGRIPAPLLPLLPGVLLVPVLVRLLSDVHAGGVGLVLQFWCSALQPSLEPVLMRSLLGSIGVTLVMAVLSWLISSATGLALGLLCSRRVASLFGGRGWLARALRRVLAPVRALHELVWGLLLLQLFGLNGWVAVLAISLPYGALMARVVADQIDQKPSSAAQALCNGGASPAGTLITAVVPEAASGLLSHSGNRLDCALRSAVLLGVFGLGGIGTDLALSLQSLRFQEVWSGLWLLAGLMLLLDRLRQRPRLLGGLVLLCLVLTSSHLDLSIPQFSAPVLDTTTSPWLDALTQTDWVELIGSTLVVTLLAAALAIALPPLVLLLTLRRRRWRQPLWTLLRLIPAPLTALLLLLMIQPSIVLAAVALGLHHSGVMGRVMEEDLRNAGEQQLEALRQIGAGDRAAVLYGQLGPISRPYLAYGLVRLDVILRDTAVVGMVGGAGLGWQLIDSLGSFHWALVLWLLMAYGLLTLCGEAVSDWLQKAWSCKAVGV